MAPRTMRLALLVLVAAVDARFHETVNPSLTHKPEVYVKQRRALQQVTEGCACSHASVSPITHRFSRCIIELIRFFIHSLPITG